MDIENTLQSKNDWLYIHFVKILQLIFSEDLKYKTIFI